MINIILKKHLGEKLNGLDSEKSSFINVKNDVNCTLTVVQQLIEKK